MKTAPAKKERKPPKLWLCGVMRATVRLVLPHLVIPGSPGLLGYWANHPMNDSAGTHHTLTLIVTQ